MTKTQLGSEERESHGVVDKHESGVAWRKHRGMEVQRHGSMEARRIVRVNFGNIYITVHSCTRIHIDETVRMIPTSTEPETEQIR